MNPNKFRKDFANFCSPLSNHSKWGDAIESKMKEEEE